MPIEGEGIVDVRDYVAFYWDRMDAWFEEKEEKEEKGKEEEGGREYKGYSLWQAGDDLL